MQAETPDPRREAKTLYWQGWTVSSIAGHLKQPRNTVASWKTRDKWDESPVIQKVESSLEARYIQLINKEEKSGKDFKEIDLLGRQMERFARIRKYLGPEGNEVHLNPNIARRNEAKKKQRNHFTEEQAEELLSAFKKSLFAYQDVWWENRDQRTRAILKSRQIGATWYFAREALMDAVQTGGNQIFLSASKAQANVFRNYIIQFAKEACGVELVGNPIVLSNGAELHFLGTNARTAQSYHGNFYFDEFFWVGKFEELNKVASGMAMHKQWRKTYFSTPSSMSHEAYPFWTGAQFNKRLKKDGKAPIDISHKRLAAGALCEDMIWRQIVTIEDAAKGGCDLFDIEHLRNYEYTPDQFSNLLMCNFIDDTSSVFPLSVMQRCMVDAWDAWSDFKPFTSRPFGDRQVWIGYDPSHNGDSAGCAVIAPPLVPGGKFRVLESHQFRGMDFAAQAELIRQLTLKYNVTYIGIDSTGIGQGVLQNVRLFYPAAHEIIYNMAVKTQMVIKTQDVIGKGRLEFDSGNLDLVQSFMAIRKTLTASQRQVTYIAIRGEDIGHADLAWAAMHAISHEPLAVPTNNSQSFMEIS